MKFRIGSLGVSDCAKDAESLKEKLCGEFNDKHVSVIYYTQSGMRQCRFYSVRNGKVFDTYKPELQVDLKHLDSEAIVTDLVLF
tara:strand:- start:462 stop:713 length:252 start_codon:yes stop_codon:yes gene_type:complete